MGLISPWSTGCIGPCSNPCDLSARTFPEREAPIVTVLLSGSQDTLDTGQIQLLRSCQRTSSRRRQPILSLLTVHYPRLLTGIAGRGIRSSFFAAAQKRACLAALVRFRHTASISAACVTRGVDAAHVNEQAVELFRCGRPRDRLCTDSNPCPQRKSPPSKTTTRFACAPSGRIAALTRPRSSLQCW